MLSRFEILIFFFSSSRTKGKILKSSPTLDPWNQIKFPTTLFFDGKQNFSLNLFLSSFLLDILKIIISGENTNNIDISIWYKKNIILFEFVFHKSFYKDLNFLAALRAYRLQLHYPNPLYIFGLSLELLKAYVL